MLGSLIKLGTSLIGGSKAKKANAKALAAYTTGANNANTALQGGYDTAERARLEGYDGARTARLDGYTNLRKNVDEGYEELGNLQTDDTQAFNDGTGEIYDAYATDMGGIQSRYADARRGGMRGYGAAVTGLSDIYADDIYESADWAAGNYVGSGYELAGDIEGVADNFATEIGGVASNFDDRLQSELGKFRTARMEGLDKSNAILNPYAEMGGQGFQVIRAAAAQDPSKLTPSQQAAMADYERDSRARLAASGLRGAGRAGVAAVNTGAGRLTGQFYDTNVRRSDQAAGDLANYGYSASNRMASATDDAYTDVADLGAEYGETGASAIRTAGAAGAEARRGARTRGAEIRGTARDKATTTRHGARDAGSKVRYDAGRDATDYYADTEEDIAVSDRTIASNVGQTRAKLSGAALDNDARLRAERRGDTRNYYGNLGNIYAGEAEVNAGTYMGKAGVTADTAMGKAGSTANTEMGIADATAGKIRANGQITSQMWGSAGNALADIAAPYESKLTSIFSGGNSGSGGFTMNGQRFEW